MALTEEAQKQYVEDGGVHCPYCGSYDVNGNGIDLDGPVMSSQVSCLECGKHWNDVYRLVSISEYEE